MRVSAGASRWASSRSTKRRGTSRAAARTSSTDAAAKIERRSAKGLRESSDIRLLAERMPRTAPPASSTGRWLTPAAIISMAASGASRSARSVLAGIVMMALTGRLARHAAGDDLVAQVDVGDDAEALARPHEQGGRRLSAISLGGVMDAGARLAEDRRATEQRGHGTGVHVGQGAHGPRRLDQAVAQGARHEAHALGTAQHLESHVLGEAVEQRPLPRARRELGRQAGEQRRVTEDLTGPDDGDDGLLVDKLERAVAHDEELGARRAALDEDRLAGLDDALDDGAAIRSSSSAPSPTNGSTRARKATRPATLWSASPRPDGRDGMRLPAARRGGRPGSCRSRWHPPMAQGRRVAGSSRLASTSRLARVLEDDGHAGARARARAPARSRARRAEREVLIARRGVRGCRAGARCLSGARGSASQAARLPVSAA